MDNVAPETIQEQQLYNIEIPSSVLPGGRFATMIRGKRIVLACPLDKKGGDQHTFSVTIEKIVERLPVAANIEPIAPLPPPRRQTQPLFSGERKEPSEQNNNVFSEFFEVQEQNEFVSFNGEMEDEEQPVILSEHEKLHEEISMYKGKLSYLREDV